MKNRQMKIVILILVGLVFFTTSLALLMYSKQEGADKQHNMPNMVEVYLSAKDIKRGELLGADSIKKGRLPKEYIDAAPLTASEIIGRYAKTDIFANEPIRKQKISLVKPTEHKEKAVEATPQIKEPQVDEELDTIALPLSVFKNIDTSLKMGDKIDIVSVESKKDGREMSFSAKYIALNVTIDAFVANGKRVKNYISSYVEGKAVYAQNIVLKISPKEIKNFLMLYYRTLALNKNRVYNTNNNGGHLWIVKCSQQQDKKRQKTKEKMLADYVAKVKHRVKRVSYEASISYEK
ncbi:MAG: SAF domain-containing protein [Sulfurimonas sp.]